jgi:hypothetical protein
MDRKLVTAAVEQTIAARFGSGPIVGTTNALMVTATKPMA